MAGKRKRGGKEDTQVPSDTRKKTKKNDKTSSSSAAQPDLTTNKTPFVETPTGDERRREAALYDLLGSDDEADRLQAADCIISSLLGGDRVPETVLQRHLDRRLFRGLASGRNASRIGFSLVITEIISQLLGAKGLAHTKYPGLSFEKLLGFLLGQTQPTGNVPGQEERDHFLGQLFGIECFVKSKVLFTDPSRWYKILELLLQLGYKKVWLRSQCGWVIVQALEQMSKQEAETTLREIADKGLAKTPEGVAIWLVALNRFPTLKVKPWHHPLSNKSLGDLTAVLKESFQDQDKTQIDEGHKNKKQSTWSAQLHFVWDIILSHFVQQGISGKAELEQFWSRVVDEGLFSRNATDGQKFKGFTVFQKLVIGLVDQHELLECLFSKNLVACLMNQAAKEDRYLHRAAIKTLKTIETLVSQHPVTLTTIFKGLVGTHGAYNFDQRTNTKTVDKLLQSLNEENEDAVLEIIRQPLKGLEKKEKGEAQSILRTFVDYLSKCLNGLASSDDKPNESLSGTTFGVVLQELARFAYSHPDEVPQDLLTEQIRELCRSRLETSLARLVRRSNDFEVFCTAVASIDSSAVTMDQEIRASMEQASGRMHKLLKRKSKSVAEKSLYQGLAMLHSVSIFQLFNEDPDAMEVLQDLEEFSNRLKKGSLGEDGAGSSELLVEILLSMVTRPSSLMRQVSQRVFEAFTGQISAEALTLLTGPLSSGESTKGQKELFNTEDDEMEVDDNEGSDDDDVEEVSDAEVDSNVEFVQLNGEDAETDGDELDEDESGKEENDDQEEEEEEEEGDDAENLDKLLGNILNSHRLDKDVDASSSDSDNDMSDAEMLARDDKLADALRPHIRGPSNTKKQKKDAKQSVVNFKHRIIDLLDIYVKNEPLNPITFTLLNPLLGLMRTTSTKALASRGCEVILNYQKGLKKARSNSNKEGAAIVADTDELLGLLVEVHEEAGKDNSHAYAKAASAASLIIASAMFMSDKAAIKQVAAVYAKTQSQWVLGEAKLQSSFFADWNNWCQNQAKG